jgi:hypothetical protein
MEQKRMPFYFKMWFIILLCFTGYGIIPAIILYIKRAKQYPESRKAARKAVAGILMLFVAATGILFYFLNSGDLLEHGTSVDVQKADKPTYTFEDVVATLFHEPQLKEYGIKAHYSADRKAMAAKMKSALLNSPVNVKKEKGGLFQNDYFAVTAQSGDLLYYGQTKKNRPEGFGILCTDTVTTDDYSSMQYLIYAGMFKKGLPEGYGAMFKNAGTIFTWDMDYLRDFSRKELNDVYLHAYVTSDGMWSGGYGDGDINEFSIMGIATDIDRTVLHTKITHYKDGTEEGTRAQYVNDVLVYKGDVSNGKRDGKGVSYYDSGAKEYDGNWKNGKYNGQGTLYDESGKVLYSGKWKDGDYAS